MTDEMLTRIAEAVAKEVSGKKLTLAAARRLIALVEARAEEMGVRAVVAVSDSAARPVAIECMDDAYIASFDIALSKSYTAAALKMSTATLKMSAQPGGSLYGIQFTNQGRIVVFGGGDPLIHGGKIIGGIGVSGGTEEQDTALSAYGAACVGEIMKGEL